MNPHMPILKVIAPSIHSLVLERSSARVVNEGLKLTLLYTHKDP